MPASIRLGRIAGIPVGLHYSWFLIAALITVSLAGQFGATHAEWSAAATWSVAAVTAVLFFGTLLAHELAHAVVARVRGLPVRSITLFALGGIANIGREANSARTEFLVAVVGPIVSFAIGFACIGAARTLGWSLEGGAAGIAGSILGWLGSINVLLAVFNLIPGYPLDGGRLLRAALWGAYNDMDRATRNAARVGQAVAGLFIALGVFQFFTGAGFGGLWIAFIGWFLLMAAQASYAEAAIGQALHDVRVADVMADEPLLEGEPAGTVRPLDPSTPAAEALKVMVREDISRLPVVSGGRVQGTVSRDRLLRLLKVRRREPKAA